MPEALAHIALAGVTALAWLGLGSLVLASLARSGDRALDALNRIGAGALAWGLLTLAAGWVGLLHRAVYLPPFVLAAAAGALAAARLLRGARWPRPLGWPRWQLALAVLLGVYALVALVAACAPVSSADALHYHVGVPEHYVAEHEVFETPWSWNSYQPFAVEMLITDGLLLWDPVQGAMAPLLLGLAALATVLVAAERLAGRAVALLAGAVFFAQPFMLWISTSSFVEPGLAFAIALATWNLVEFARRGRVESLALAGLLAGGAAGMKYIGAAAAVVLALAATVALRRRLRPRLVLAFALPAVAVALPWYVKNAVLTGNPVYPLVFGGQSAEAERAAEATFEGYGHGESPLDLLLLPLRLLGDADEFDRGEFVSPLFLLFAPLALLSRRARAAATLVGAAGGCYVLAWFLGSQQSRFLVPLMPAAAVLAAVGMIALTARGRVGRLATAGVVAAALATGAAVSAAYAGQLLPAAVGFESDRRFLLENTSYYAATDWANRRLPEGSRVLVDHVFVQPFEEPAIAWTLDALPSDAGPYETRAFFRRYGLTHALVFERNATRLRQLDSVRARPLAAVEVRPVVSRTLNELGPTTRMLVFAL